MTMLERNKGICLPWRGGGDWTLWEAQQSETIKEQAECRGSARVGGSYLGPRAYFASCPVKAWHGSGQRNPCWMKECQMCPRCYCPEHLWSGPSSLLILWPLHTPGAQGKAVVILEPPWMKPTCTLLFPMGGNHKKQDSELHIKLGLTAVPRKVQWLVAATSTSTSWEPVGKASLFHRRCCPRVIFVWIHSFIFGVVGSEQIQVFL